METLEEEVSRNEEDVLSVIGGELGDDFCLISPDGFAYQPTNDDQTAWQTNDGGVLTDCPLRKLLQDYVLGESTYRELLERFWLADIHMVLVKKTEVKWHSQ